MTANVPERIRELVEPIVHDLGLELYDLEHNGSTLAVTVDRPSGGVDLEAITSVTRALSRALDDADPISGRYQLEVSSPGLERVLRTPAHFAGAVGSIISVKTIASYDGPRRVTGTLLEVGGDDTIVVDDVELSYDDIEKARTVFEWGPAPKPGKSNKPGKNATSGKNASKQARKVTSP